MKYKIVALLHDRPGVLNRVGGVFRRRNINIDSVIVVKTSQPNVSKMMLEVDADRVDLVVNQLEKLIDVFEVQSYSELDSEEKLSTINWCQADGVA